MTDSEREAALRINRLLEQLNASPPEGWVSRLRRALGGPSVEFTQALAESMVVVTREEERDEAIQAAYASGVVMGRALAESDPSDAQEVANA
jgi:hypothetical protein